MASRWEVRVVDCAACEQHLDERKGTFPRAALVDTQRDRQPRRSRDAWLAESMAAANEVARAVSDQFKDRDEALTVTANRGTDRPDDPAVVFVVRITIADDFDPDDWPGDLVAEAKESVRTRAVERLPESMPFYVVVSQRTPSPAA